MTKTPVALAILALGGVGWWIYSRHQPDPVQGNQGDKLAPWGGFDINQILPGGSNDMKPYQLAGGSPIPKGIRNNNPLNVEAGDPWQGMTGSDGRFATFDDPFYGIRAGARVMRTYKTRHGLDTIRGIVGRWAPPTDDNPTESYIRFVSTKAAIDQDRQLTLADYPRVITAMIHFENGYNPYDQELIKNAVTAGFK